MVDRKHPLAHCEDCPLQVGGRYVPSEGPSKAEIAFVGEAPGVQEARGGRPFIGPSGKLLELVMEHHGIHRKDVFLTNACLCRPADGSTPTRSAIEACKPRLVDELLEHDVNSVVALGNSAAEGTLGLSGVTKLRIGPGRYHDSLPGVRIIPTLHPAAALRQADFFPTIVTDVGKLVNVAMVWDEPQYVVADNELDALRLIQAVCDRGAEYLVVDIEVDVEKDFSFAHPNQYGMLCVGIGYARGKALVLGEGAMASEAVRSALGDLLRSHRIAAQNGKFDLAGLYPTLGALELWFDTMLASYACDERAGIHGLKFQGVEYLGAPQWDDEIKRYVGKGAGYGAIPRDKLYRYNASDIVATWALVEMYEKRFDTDETGTLRKVHDFLVRASNQMMYVELNGIAVDREYLKELEQEFLASIDIIREELDLVIKRGGKDYDSRKSPWQLNPNSPLQVKKWLLDNKVEVNSTGKEVLEFILEKHSKQISDDVKEFIGILLKHRKEAKLYGTYVKGIRQRLYRGRVYPTFLLHGTTTGRLACRNPNMQNIPRQSSIRKLFIPAKDGNVFLQTDYAQAELRVLTYLAKDTYFRDIFNGGQRDLFDELTPILYEDADKDKLGAAAWKELRIRVKAYVYGLAYGRRGFSIASEYDIPVSEAKQGMRRFFDVIPEIVSFREETRARVLSGEDLITPWGRHRRYGLITNENVKDVMNEALAFLPQSTASDMCLSALVEVRQKTRGFAWIRNIVHDSLLVECAPEDVEEVQSIVEAEMIAAGQLIVGDYVKIAVDSKVGQHWGEV